MILSSMAPVCLSWVPFFTHIVYLLGAFHSFIHSNLYSVFIEHLLSWMMLSDSEIQQGLKSKSLPWTYTFIMRARQQPNKAEGEPTEKDTDPRYSVWSTWRDPSAVPGFRTGMPRWLGDSWTNLIIVRELACRHQVEFCFMCGRNT